MTRKWSGVRLFISPSEFVLRLAAQAGVDEDLLTLLRNPAHMLQAEVTKDRDLCFVGRLEQNKGLSVLSAMARSGLNVDCYGTLGKDVKIPPAINWRGPLSPLEVPTVLSRYKVLAFPSLYEENCPMTVLEAFAASVAVCAFDVGGISELTGLRGERGVLVPRGDADSLAAEANALLTDPDRRIRMVDRARAFLSAHCDPAKHARALEHLYGKALQ